MPNPAFMETGSSTGEYAETATSTPTTIADTSSGDDSTGASSEVGSEGESMTEGPDPTTGDDSGSETTADTTSGTTIGTTTGESATDSDTSDTEGACEEVVWYRDFDLDGHAGNSEQLLLCAGEQPPADYYAEADDCDDANDIVSPSANEVCDGLDNNCNHLRDEFSDLNHACEVILGATCFNAEYEGHFYYFCQDLTFPDGFPPAAELKCTEFATAPNLSHLMAIESQAEHEFAVPYVTDLVQVETLIGLYDALGNNNLEQYQWTGGGQLVGYGADGQTPPWKSNEPNNFDEQWVVLRADTGLWNDVTNDYPYAFACEAIPGE